MSVPLYQAIRFVHPDLDDPSGPAGLRFTNRGSIEMVDGRSSLRQAILLLLSTRTGERVMRPNYGCNLHRLAFQPNDDTTAGLAMHYVRQAIERWERRVEILRLDATPTRETGTLEIFLEYRVRATQQTERVAYAFDLTGERT